MKCEAREAGGIGPLKPCSDTMSLERAESSNESFEVGFQCFPILPFAEEAHLLSES